MLTTVYLVLGGEVDGLAYHDKGWTSFEYLLATLIKPANTSGLKDWPMLLDLTGGEMKKDVWGGDAGNFDARPAPIEPLAFQPGHAYGAKIYTNGADRDKIVAPKFERTIEEVLGGAEKLDCNALPWGDAGAVQLAGVLRMCVSLKELQLYGAGVGDAGAAALGEALGAMRGASLEVLGLWANGIGDDGAMALAEGLKTCTAPLRGLNLEGNRRISEAGKAAVHEAAKAVPSLNVYF